MVSTETFPQGFFFSIMHYMKTSKMTQGPDSLRPVIAGLIVYELLLSHKKGHAHEDASLTKGKQEQNKITKSW